MSYEEKVHRIESDDEKNSEFDKDTLFKNIYHFRYFTNYVSMYYLWKWTALEYLKMNLRQKWPKTL